jgi:hypothetical protein
MPLIGFSMLCLSLYKTRDRHLARLKGGVSADRIQNDLVFQRTRENGEEFGRAGAAGKLIRMAEIMHCQLSGYQVYNWISECV